MSITAILQALKWLGKNPLVIVIFVLGSLNLFQTFANMSKNVEIANLKSSVTKLESRNSTLQTNIDNANEAIANQNASILARAKIEDQLRDRLYLAKQANLELDKKIADLLESSNTSPVDSSGALNWLREKAEEIKSWQSQQ